MIAKRRPGSGTVAQTSLLFDLFQYGGQDFGRGQTGAGRLVDQLNHDDLAPGDLLAPSVLGRKSDEQILVVMNGRCQKTTRRDVVMVQLVDQPAVAGFSATKFLADLLKEFETKSSPRSADDHG